MGPRLTCLFLRHQPLELQSAAVDGGVAMVMIVLTACGAFENIWSSSRRDQHCMKLQCIMVSNIEFEVSLRACSGRSERKRRKKRISTKILQTSQPRASNQALGLEASDQ
jgi:hypothetical protein